MKLTKVVISMFLILNNLSITNCYLTYLNLPSANLPPTQAKLAYHLPTLACPS